MNNKVNFYDVLIIGAGPAGMSCAIAAAQKGLKVIIIDKNKKCGNKLYATGNGRCNIGNTVFDNKCYYGADIYWDKDFKEHMEDFLGIPLKIEKDGLLYPVSNQASTVVWAFCDALKALNVSIVTKSEVTKVKGEYGRYVISDNNGCKYYSRNVVFAYGGLSYKKLGAADEDNLKRLISEFDIKLEKMSPALTGIKTVNDFTNVSGVRNRTKASVFWNGKLIDSEIGELQITDYGLSGIMIFNLALYFSDNNVENAELILDFIPDYSIDYLCRCFEKLKINTPKRIFASFLNGYMNDKLAYYLIDEYKKSGKKLINANEKLENLSKNDIEKFFSFVKEFRVFFKELCDYDKAQVTKGGISLDSINMDTMGIINYKGLYAVGEALDVIGKCGGYNIMWAISSGIKAGENIE